MLVRRAAPADAAAIAALQVEAWQGSMSAWAPPAAVASITVETQAPKYAARAADPDYTLLVATQGDALAAFACSRTNDTAATGFAREISALYVATAFERQGVATTLLNVLRKEPRSGGGLVIWTFRDNAPARALYESRGATLLPFTDYPNDWAIPHVSYGWDAS
jgi:GNAT superfamily N-acetyltransferase